MSPISLLERQLRALGLKRDELPASLADWQEFLARIERAYAGAEQDRYLLERSLEISSKEMQERWQLIEHERAKVLHSEKMATLGEMAGGVAHEINNPLAVIQVTADQIQDLLAEETLDLPMTQKMVRTIQTTVGRIAKIVMGLRSFSRDGSQDPFSPEKLGNIIDETVALCGRRLRESDVILEMGPVDPELKIDCRATQISQVILNLLQNASDAASTSAEKWVKISATDHGESVELTVTDSGPGIPENIREKIFQPFFTTKEVGKGTGLGLSVVRGILNAHQASITIDAASPHTRFVIVLKKRLDRAGQNSAA